MFQNLNCQRFDSVGSFGVGACCERSLSGAFSRLFVSALQCSRHELHEVVIRFLPTLGGKKKKWLIFDRTVLHKNSHFYVAASNFMTCAPNNP